LVLDESLIRELHTRSDKVFVADLVIVAQKLDIDFMLVVVIEEDASAFREKTD